jgi:ketosteroid isomerase-like protein
MLPQTALCKPFSSESRWRRFIATLALVVLAGAGFAWNPPPRAAQDSAELVFARDLVNRFYGTFARLPFDVDSLMDNYDPQVEFVDPTFDIEVSGIAEVRNLYAGAGEGASRYREIRWDIQTVVASGSDIAVRGVWSGTFDGKPFTVDFVTLWRLRDGKIVSQQDFFDAIGFDQQVDWRGDASGE